MTADLKSLADALAEVKDVLEGDGYWCPPFDAALTLVRTLADADAKMPVVGYLAESGTVFFGMNMAGSNAHGLCKVSDAQAAILAATERAEKAEASATRLLEALQSCLASLDAIEFSPHGALLARAAIDQHLGADPTAAGSPSTAAPREAG